jgi:hypothetical protein
LAVLGSRVEEVFRVGRMEEVRKGSLRLSKEEEEIEQGGV